MLLITAQNCKKNLKVHCIFPTRQTVVNVSEEQACDRQQFVCQTVCMRNVQPQASQCQQWHLGTTTYHKERNLEEAKAQIVYLWLRDSSQPTGVFNSFSHGAEEDERLHNDFLFLKESLITERSSKMKKNRCLSTVLNKFVLCYAQSPGYWQSDFQSVNLANKM